MRRILGVLCLLCILLTPAALAAESGIALTYDLTADGENAVTVSSGDIVTVTFTIRRTDSQERYSLNVLQNEIMYDQNFFEFVEGSIVTERAQYAQLATRVAGEHIIKVSSMLAACGAEELFCTFQLKVVAKSGSGRVYCDQAKAFDSDSSPVAITEQNLTVRIAGGGAGGGGGGGTAEAEQTEQAGPSFTFTDVPESAWYYEAVAYAAKQGYFQGTSKTAFAPDAAMTRAMFAAVVARMAGADLSEYTQSGFSDVDQGAWYAPSVAWAAENGIVLGLGGGMFGPEQTVTREQMAAILYRYARFLEPDAGGVDQGVLNAFSDGGSVSGWAAEAMAWAVNAGVMNGTGSGLKPQGEASRAEVAQLLMNYDSTK